MGEDLSLPTLAKRIKLKQFIQGLAEITVEMVKVIKGR